MRQAILIFNKEFRDYFASPIAYIVIAIFLAVIGWLFFSTFFLFDQADMRGFFGLLPIFFALVVPIVTMRLFSEELNVGSYELLLTLPVTFRDIIVGKYLAAVAFVAALLVPTLAYPIFISFLGDLDWGVVAGGYVGALLLGSAYAAIGLFASSLTRNQIIACIVAIVICIPLAIFDQMLYFFPQSILDVFSYLSANAHFSNIAKGIIDSRDLVYFLSIAFIGLYATHLVMEEK
ncbi:MAG: ABC transporter permease subunit [Desulfatitalea sp.]|nr:ABC transporter permease subunit [Desulfatitalea sp.]NNK00791.1 ABC transporter permease subunit [Desulfatitalea sp.]